MQCAECGADITWPRLKVFPNVFKDERTDVPDLPDMPMVVRFEDGGTAFVPAPNRLLRQHWKGPTKGLLHERQRITIKEFYFIRLREWT